MDDNDDEDDEQIEEDSGSSSLDHFQAVVVHDFDQNFAGPSVEQTHLLDYADDDEEDDCESKHRGVLQSVQFETELRDLGVDGGGTYRSMTGAESPSADEAPPTRTSLRRNKRMASDEPAAVDPSTAATSAAAATPDETAKGAKQQAKSAARQNRTQPTSINRRPMTRASRAAQQGQDSAEPLAAPEESTAKKGKEKRRPKTVKDEDDDADETAETSKHAAETDHKAILSSSDRGILIGESYQAKLPTGAQSSESDHDLDSITDRERPMWRPPRKIRLSDERMDEYLEAAIVGRGITFDRALFILMSCKYNIVAAMDQLRRYRQLSDVWSADDRALFRHAYQQHGKNFHKMRSILPHRSTQALVNFYYNTKKEINYKSAVETRTGYAGDGNNYLANLLDRAERGAGGTSGGDDGGVGSPADTRCHNCEESVRNLRTTDTQLKLCTACFTYFRTLGLHRECVPSSSSRLLAQPPLFKCPRDMIEIASDFTNMVKPAIRDGGGDNPPSVSRRTAAAAAVTPAVATVPSHTVCHVKMGETRQQLEQARARCLRYHNQLRLRADYLLKDGIDKFRSLAGSSQHHHGSGGHERSRQQRTYTWSESEKITAFHCFLRYGKDFGAASEVLTSKTANQLKSYYSEVREHVEALMHEAQVKEAAAVRAFDVNVEFGAVPTPQTEVVVIDDD